MIAALPAANTAVPSRTRPNYRLNERATRVDHTEDVWPSSTICMPTERNGVPQMERLRDYQAYWMDQFISGKAISEIAEQTHFIFSEVGLQLVQKRLDLVATTKRSGRTVRQDQLKNDCTPEVKAFIELLIRKRFLVREGDEHLPAPAVQTATLPVSSRLKKVFYYEIPIFVAGGPLDPRKFLNAIDPWCSWFFSFPAVVIFTLISAMILLRFLTGTELLRGTGSFQYFAQHTPWLSLLFGLLVMKIPHEIGHAIALRRLRRHEAYNFDVYEMGLIFLIFTPCLYCRVDDVNMSISRARKVWVMLAGVYVDIVVSALAVLVYFLLPPGEGEFARMLVITNIGYTMFVNLFPLMRFDGHYALSYAIGRPSLRAQSVEYLQVKLTSFLFGTNGAHREDRRAFTSLLAVFAVSSVVYSFVIIYGISTFMYWVGEPYDFGPPLALASCLILTSNSTNLLSMKGNK